MKPFKVIFGILIISAVSLLFSCDKTTEESCGEAATQRWDYIAPEFVQIDGISGNAQFRFDVEATNVCIFDLATVYIQIYQKIGSSIEYVNAFALVPNSTAPQINMRLDVYDNWNNESYLLNLRQGFNKNPGSFKIRVYIYVSATSQAEAEQKLDASYDISKSYVAVEYKRPK